MFQESIKKNNQQHTSDVAMDHVCTSQQGISFQSLKIFVL